MQFKGLALVASAFVFAACGGGSESQPAAEATPAPAAEATPAPAAGGAVAAAPATGTTHEVKMIGDDKGYRFEPANFTIKAGDAVKFVFVSGGPHNVAFDGSTLAAPVKAQLDANFGTAKMAELSSNMFMAAGEGITISFANIPAGEYHYNCTPHLAMGMKGIITVQ
jgi:plastocyanin